MHKRRASALIKKTLQWRHRSYGENFIALPTESVPEPKRLKIIGNCLVQDGTILGVGTPVEDGYEIRLHLHGKNLMSGMDFYNMVIENLGADVADLSEDGTYAVFHFEEKYEKMPAVRPDQLNFKPGKRYMFRIHTKYPSQISYEYTNLRIEYTDGTGLDIAKSGKASEFQVAASSSLAKSVSHISVNNRADKDTIIYFDDFGFIEAGKGATEYIGEKFTIPIGSPLYGIDGANDELDPVEGLLTRRIASCTIDADCSLEYLENGIFLYQPPIAAKSERRVVCPSLPYVSYQELMNDPQLMGICTNCSGGIIFRADPNINDTDAIISYIENDAMRICYVMESYEQIVLDTPLPQLAEGYTDIDILCDTLPKKFYLEFV